jgi:phosphoheptose isomerase
MAHLYRHPKLLALFGRQAIARTNAMFTWQHVATGVAAVYEQVVAGHPGNRAEARLLAVVDRGFDEAVRAVQQSHARLRHLVLAAAEELLACFAGGGKVLVCGNGGSAADAQHLVGELVGRFRSPGRRALPALALTADSAVLTGWSNDEGYDKVFSRQVEAFGRPGDVIVGITTSGRSRNVLEAFGTARGAGMRTIGILGGDGGAAAALCDIPVIAASEDTQRIQEVHTLVIHLVCELVEAGVLDESGERRGTAAISAV